MMTQAKQTQGSVHPPSGWVETTLGEVCEIFGGYAFKGSHFVSKGNVNVIKIKDIQPPIVDVENSSSLDISSYNLDKIKKFKLINGDFLVAMTGATIGKIGKFTSDREVYLNQRVAKIDSIKNVSDKNFINQLISQSNFEKFIYTISSGSSAQQNVSATDIGKFPTLLPPLPEQRAIAGVLSAFDDKIELLREQNKTLEATAQAIFGEWFGKYSPDRPEDLPEGWRVGKIEDFFDFLEGPGIRNWQYTEAGTRFINIRLIQNSDILIKNSNFISDEEAQGKYAHFMLKEKDYVLSTSGTLGRGAIVRKSHLPLMLNTSVIRFRPLDNISYGFTYQYLQSRYFLHEVSSLASGSVQLNFGPVHLRKIEIVIPNKEKLSIFAKSIDPIYEKIRENSQQIQTLSTFRDTLLPRLMRGEVRVGF